ncbi:LacI family DNA-binding transcriptional regulator [Testudinibacter sp. P27/CKL/0425]
MNKNKMGLSVNTMQQLAEYIGLSRQTLSKYFNDPQQVSSHTQLLIRAAVEETGFRPNLFASNLKRNKSRVIGIIIPSITDPFYMQLVSRISTIAEASGYFIFTLPSNGKLSVEADAVAKLQAMNVAGVLIVPLGKDSVQSKLIRMEDDLPIVYLDSPPKHDAPFIGTDNQQGITLLVDYLCQSGTPPAFLAMPEINRNAKTRLHSYETAMGKNKENPCVLKADSCVDWEFETYGYHRTTRWLHERKTKHQALLCANDRLAYGAFLATWEKGIPIGIREDGLRIAGHDDHPLAAYTCPPLTTAAQDYDGIAKLAIDTLLGYINGNRPLTTPQLVPMTLVRRQSA